jgi:diguanylate cyclase (GGDEF)-like protein
MNNAGNPARISAVTSNAIHRMGGPDHERAIAQPRTRQTMKLTRFLPQTKIVLTAEAELSDLEIFRESGWPYDILVCPFEKEELLEKTGAWVREAICYDLATGLYNARHFGFILDTEVMRSERYGYTFSIILSEIRRRWSLQDDNESIRKRNRLLRQIAHKVKSLCRLIDFAFHLLDNEFALLLLQTTRASAERIIELLRKLFQESRWEDEARVTLTLM